MMVVAPRVVEDVVDVVVDALAEVDEGLAPSGDAAQVGGQAADRVEGGAGVHLALGIELVADRVALLAHVAGALLLVEAFERRRADLAPHELVDRRQQPALAVGELLGGVRAAAREHDRRAVVGADVALDELARRRLGALGAQGVGVDVVEHQHVDAAVVAGEVVLDVGLDRRLREQRLRLPLDRDVHQRERRDLLRLAVLEHLEVAFAEPGDEAALGVDDAGVDLDVVDLGAEGDRAVCGGAGRWAAGRRSAPGPTARRRSPAPPGRAGQVSTGHGHDPDDDDSPGARSGRQGAALKV